MRVKPGGAFSPQTAAAAVAGSAAAGSAVALRDGPQLPLSLLLGLEHHPAPLPVDVLHLPPLPAAPAPAAALAAPHLPFLPAAPAPAAALAAPHLPSLPAARAPGAALAAPHLLPLPAAQAPAAALAAPHLPPLPAAQPPAAALATPHLPPLPLAPAAAAGPATPVALAHMSGISSKRAVTDALLAAALRASQHLIPSLPDAADLEHQQPRRQWHSSLQQQRPAGSLGPALAAALGADSDGGPANRRRSSLRSPSMAAGTARLHPAGAAAQGGSAKRVRFESPPARRAAGWQLVSRTVILQQQPPTPEPRVVR
jgi:hypothetical protein